MSLGYQTKEFADLMMNWMDILNSSVMRMGEATNPTDNVFASANSSDNKGKSSLQTLPPPSSKSGSSSSLSPSSATTTTSTSRRKSKSKSKKKKKKSKKSRPKKLLPVFETSTNTSNDVIMELNQANEGFDLHIGQTVCDDGRPSMGEEAKSYFLMRHSFLYPGPLMAMMQMGGGMGGGGGSLSGYRVSAEAVHRDKYVLVGSYTGNNVEGVWEHTWTKHLKSHITFVAGFESAQARQMAMMMGMGGAGPRFPAAIMNFDYRRPNFSTRLHVDMMKNQLSMSFNRRITQHFQIGTRISSSYDQRKTTIEFGGKYLWKARAASNASADSNNNSSKSPSSSSASSTSERGKKRDKEGGSGGKRSMMSVHSKAGQHCVEGLYDMGANTAQLMYSHHVTENAALTSRFSWRVGSADAMMATIGYRYQFGKHLQMSKSICGEIASDGNMRQMITFPVLGNMMAKFYGEVNHFLSPQQMQQGQMPHKFGFQLNIHL